MTGEFAFRGTATADAWETWSFDNVVNDNGTVRLRRERLPDYVDPEVVVELDARDSPVVDIDVDTCGDLYLLRESGHVDRYDADADRLDRLGCDAVGPPDAIARSLAVMTDTVYVASAVAADGTDQPDGSGDDSGPNGADVSDTEPTPRGSVTAIARHIEQRRWRTTVPDGTPVAMADDGDRVYALFETDDEGYLATVARDGDVAPVLDGLPGPLDVAIDAEGTTYLLAEPDGRAEIRRTDVDTLDPARRVEAPAIWDVPVPTRATCLAAGEGDELFVGRTGTAAGEVTLFRVRETAQDAVASSDRDLERLHLADGLYAVETGGRSIVSFEARTSFVTHETADAHTGWMYRSFDSGEATTVWHRVTLGFSVGDADAQVRLAYAATDDPTRAQDVDWRWIDPANPHDALLDDAVGRYLWLRIELQGARFSTPRLRTVRAYFPRLSYLRYLPAIYREDDASRAFLERFLSIFESEFVGVEEEIGRMTQYLDPDGIPPAFLDWLGDWLALSPDETWPESARRELLSRAPALFRDRGTPNGLLALLNLYLSHVADPSSLWEARRERQLAAIDERVPEELSPADARTLRRRIESDVFLLEYTDLDCATGPSREPLERLLDCPQCFFVFVRPFVSDAQFETIQRLIDDTRPAHAVGRAVELEPSIVLGGHAYLGVNSVLPERDLVVGEAALGRDSALESLETAGQLGVRASLGNDTELS